MHFFIYFIFFRYNVILEAKWVALNFIGIAFVSQVRNSIDCRKSLEVDGIKKPYDFVKPERSWNYFYL